MLYGDITGAFSGGADERTTPATVNANYTAFLAQLGYHFPGTAWEIAARASQCFTEDDS